MIAFNGVDRFFWGLLRAGGEPHGWGAAGVLFGCFWGFYKSGFGRLYGDICYSDGALRAFYGQSGGLPIGKVRGEPENTVSMRDLTSKTKKYPQRKGSARGFLAHGMEAADSQYRAATMRENDFATMKQGKIKEVKIIWKNMGAFSVYFGVFSAKIRQIAKAGRENGFANVEIG